MPRNLRYYTSEIIIEPPRVCTLTTAGHKARAFQLRDERILIFHTRFPRARAAPTAGYEIMQPLYIYNISTGVYYIIHHFFLLF